MPKPSPGNYPAYFQKYVEKVPEETLIIAFEKQLPLIEQFLTSITEDESSYAYDKGKWTLKEVLQHMIDTERIFNYRALCIARKETVSLPGFDENTYVENSNANEREWKKLVDEFMAVRRSTDYLYRSLTEEALNNSGLSNNNPVSVASLGFITLGHFYHHKKVVEERYFPGLK